MEDYSKKSKEALLQEIQELRNQLSLLRISKTERELALRAQSESEKQYMALLESIKEIVYLMDKKSRLVFISPRVKDILGYLPDELLGKKYSEMIHPDDIPSLVQKTKNLKEIQETIHQFRIIHKDGSIRHVETTCKILHSLEHSLVATGIINDVTDTRLSREALRESQIKFKILEENIEDPIWVLDLDLKYIYVSPSIKKLRGRSVEEVLSTSIDKLFPPDVYLNLVTMLHDELENEEKGIPRRINYRLLELVLVDQEGKKTYVESKISFLKNETGEIIGIIGVNRDITDRKLMEEKMKRSIEEKEILLKEIHHRVKNNFQIITSLLNLQENRIHDPELLGIYRDSQNRIRAMALIHEHLYQSGNLANIDMGEYIHIIAQELFDTYGCSTERIEMKIDTKPVSLEINQAIPCGLLINEILTNAFKYGFPPYFPDKGIISICLSANDDGIVNLVICDNGIGIPEHIDIDNSETLGLQLISMITRNQLRGTLYLSRRDGTSFSISFNNRLFSPDDDINFSV